MAQRFVQECLASNRRETIETALRTKLRGRKLLLERAVTVAAGEGVKQAPTKAAKGAGSGGGGGGGGSSSRGSGGPVLKRRARQSLLEQAVREVTYESLQRQHTAWSEYAAEALARAPAGRAAAEAAKLDRHGAPLRVVRSASSSHARAEGLLLTETRRMLVLLGPSRLVWVPKAGTCVEMRLPGGHPPVRLEGLAMSRPEADCEAAPAAEEAPTKWSSF